MLFKISSEALFSSNFPLPQNKYILKTFTLARQKTTKLFRSSHQRCSMKKGVHRNFTKFTGKHLCQSLFFNKVAGLRPKTCSFIKKETLAQVFSCEFCEISKNTFLTEHLWMTGSCLLGTLYKRSIC